MSDTSAATTPAPDKNSSDELSRLNDELQAAEGRIMQLELALLQSRDFAIGAAAEASEIPILRKKFQTQFADSQRLLADANEHIRSHLAHIARLEELVADLLKLEATNKALRAQIEGLRSSASWRIGRAVLLPLRIIKRILR
ncbi:MAG: hypothetical protein ACKOH9_04400 [Actinomycetota bacterium]